MIKEGLLKAGRRNSPGLTAALRTAGAGTDAEQGVQPAALRLHAAQDVYECDPTQNCKFT